MDLRQESISKLEAWGSGWARVACNGLLSLKRELTRQRHAKYVMDLK